jgi:hypothetical protein
MQVYEEARTAHRAVCDTSMPDFKDIKSCLNKRKAKICKTPDDKVWFKWMIPCTWFFMKRRRTKDYVEIIVALIDEAEKHGLDVYVIFTLLNALYLY